MKVVAFLPAKGSSERIDSKNIKLLDGKPLFIHTLEKLKECDFIDEVYLDTESEKIIELAENVNCKVLKRKSDLATNLTDGNTLFMNEVYQVEADIYIQVLCTSPFIKKSTIKKGVLKLQETNEFDSCFLASREKLYTWDAKENYDIVPNYDIDNIPNSNTLQDTIVETMGLYIIRRSAALNMKRRIGKKPFLLEASPLESIDVNYEEDFKLANLIAAGKREKQRKLLSTIRNRLTSSILSDILDDYGIQGVLKDFKLNIDQKVLGPAKTLKIRALKKGEDFKGIYKALESYETIIPNDVIVVENEVPELAYFGELNANLAIRSGASGALINGVTRDTNEVKQLGFPVFSLGSTCKDVKGRATVDFINKEIEIQGIKIRPNDLIFGDKDGVIVIPKRLTKEVISKAFEVISKEKKILNDIANGISVLDIVESSGYF